MMQVVDVLIVEDKECVNLMERPGMVSALHTFPYGLLRPIL